MGGSFAQAARLPAPRPSGGAHRRRLHVAHRRSQRQEQDAAPIDARGGPSQRRLRAGTDRHDPRCSEDGDPVQLRLARGDALRRRDTPCQPVHGGSHSRAGRLRKAPGRAAPDFDARNPVSVVPGLRLGGDRGGRRARRQRPEIQQPRRAYAYGAVRHGAAGGRPQPAPCWHRWQGEDEPVARQLYWSYGRTERHVWQDDVDSGRRDGELLRTGNRRADGRSARRSSGTRPTRGMSSAAWPARSSAYTTARRRRKRPTTTSSPRSASGSSRWMLWKRRSRRSL